MADLKKEVEAILFSAGRTVELKEIQRLLHVNEPGLIKETIRELKDEYEAKESPLLILSEGEGWKLTVKEKFLPIVQKINPHTELSKTMLETLAVVAWKQPMLQSDVIKVRTNKAYEHLSELERLGFITKERHGRSFLIKVTQKFLDYFDLPDDKAINEVFKQFKDIELAVKKKAGALEKAAPEVPAGKHAEEGAPQEEGIELKPYVDVPPDKPVPKKETELEVYARSPEEVAADEKKEEEEEKEEAEEKAEEAKKPVETPEEKARRIAKELIGEEHPKKEEEDAEDERKLHPKLEEFIAGSIEHISPKKSAKAEPEEESEEEPAEEESPGEGEGSEEPEASEDEDDEDKPKEAEEFPGQFDESQEEDEDNR
ncbi:SMC-Scp complex subunit ScpB [Candidatus Woesearchaeota archaeon]|nr:SMC-Scp complex subunit ScpB [Candidatus Woesearchaeota archaeon]